jgi:hypothetical protein
LGQALLDLTNPQCAAVFAGGIAKGDDPSSILFALVSGSLLGGGSQYGKIIFSVIPSYAAATEQTSGGFFGKKQATIDINTITSPTATYWNAGNSAVNAITLLHELGHAFNGLFGAGSSTIQYDANKDGTPNLAAEAQNAAALAPCNH